MCQADFFFDAPIVKGYDMANLRQIPSRKDAVQSKIDSLASEHGISILAVCPKHTYSDFTVDKDGIVSACTFNDFTQISSKLNIDIDGKLSAWTSHIMSADMMSSTSWDDLG